jgi:hypothetical protein
VSVIIYTVINLKKSTNCNFSCSRLDRKEEGLSLSLKSNVSLGN